jgi:hypothetical protein
VVISAQVESIRTLGDTPDALATRQRSERERAVAAERSLKREESVPGEDAMDVDGAAKAKKEEEVCNGSVGFWLRSGPCD